jgi:hypothetical protein
MTVRMTAHHPWELGAAWVRRPGGYTPAHGSPHQALAGSGQGRAVGRLLASILGAVIELRYRRAGVDCEVRTQPYRRFRPPDLRGSSARRPRWACHCLAAPHDVRRTVSGAPAARSCGNRCGATRRDSTSGRRQPKPLVELARLRSRSQVEAADAIDHDVPGHGTFQLLRRPSDDTPAGLPRIEVSRGDVRPQIRVAILAPCTLGAIYLSPEMPCMTACCRRP